MSDPEDPITVCAEWVTKAENDLLNAAHTLKLGVTCPTDTVCFHAQQCVEKYLKALLVVKGIYFPKTHDLEALMALIPTGLRPEISSEEQARLTYFATEARYPGWGQISLAADRRAVAVARRVRREVRRELPRKTVRRRKG
jgi:HEPN domain-containing protein